MNKQRPVNLDLTTIKFPLPAIVSILHRISGLILFITLPLVLWTLKLSLSSEADYKSVTGVLNQVWIKVLIGLALAALVYHLIAGIRHLLMDSGIGESLVAGRLSAKIVFVLFVIIMLLVGVWLW